MLTTIKITGSLKNRVKIGKAVAAIIEAKETMRQIKKTINQVKTRIPIIIPNPDNFNASPSNTPKVVAIPLPPLNLRNIVQLWPQIQHNPMKIRKF